MSTQPTQPNQISSGSKLCRKCNITKSISEFSKHTGTKDKLDNRCKVCVKAIKIKIIADKKTENNINDVEVYLDKFQTDIDNTDWQGGKIIGNVFRRTTQNINYYVASIDCHQKSFNIDKLGNDKAKESAEKYILESNDKLNLTKNKYKIIKEDNKPKYIIVQLSKGYVMITDYDKLDIIKKHNLCVSNSDSDKSKKYCALTKNYSIKLFHKFITGNKMTDHINGYPLDNRIQNLRDTNSKDNNNNRTCINDISFDEVVEFNKKMIKSIITYVERGTLKKKTIESSLLLNLRDAEKWARNMSYILDKDNIDKERISRAEDFIKIMEKYAKGFKYHDIFSYNLNKSDSSESEEEIKPKKKLIKKESSGSDSSESQEEIKPKKKLIKKESSESDSSESEEEVKTKKKLIKKESSESDLSESEEEEVKPKKKLIKKESESLESDLSESEEEVKPKKKLIKKESESSKSDSSESEEEVKTIKNDSDDEKPMLGCIKDKLNIYKKYKIINPEYNIKNIELSGRSIKHITDENNEYKYCSGCEKWKLTDDFFKSKDTWDSLARSCKICKKESSSNAVKNWKERNKEKISEYNKKYREENNKIIKQKCNLTEEKKDENKLERIKKYFDKSIELIKQNGGECLSNINDYENAHSKLKIKCASGHEFDKSFNDLSKSWCPRCNIYYGESYIKYILEDYFDCNFPKIRPEWLIDKEGNKLELDGYNEDKKIAFEYLGIQYYEHESYFYKSEDDFKKRLEYHKIKIKSCEKQKIKLLIIPYDISLNELPKYIYDLCIENKLNIDENKLKDFDKFNYISCINKMNEVKNKIEKNKGEIISGIYIDSSSKFTIRCESNHIFELTLKNINRNKWCPTCELNVKDTTREKISKSLSNYLASDIGKENKKKSHEKRSETMKKEREKIRQEIIDKKCGNCNETKTIDNFCKKEAAKDGYQTWCKSCVNNKKIQKRLEK
jgi:hypothetical protein